MPSSPAPPPKRRRLAPAARRAQVLRSSRAVFMEAGLSGTTLREIASHAGVTETVVYRLFDSKEEIFRAAIEEPLHDLVVSVRNEMNKLVLDQDLDRYKLLGKANELFLGAMVEIAPLLAVTLFADTENGREYYKTSIWPQLLEAIEAMIHAGWSAEHSDPDLATLSFLGVHYGVVMDALLSDETLDVPAAAEKITALFSRSLQRTEPDDDPVERPRRTRLTAPERRKQILAAAREVFLQYGLSGTRMRHIAGKAGLTEAGLYAHFASKDEIYREAVTEPLERLVDQFVSRTLVLSRSEGVSREAIMLQANEELLACMVELTPLLAVALFSEMGKGQEFYREVFLPKLEIATRSLVEGIYGRDAPVEDFDVVVEAMLGVHFGVALDHLMRGTPVDIPKVAARLTRMIQLDGGTTDTSS